MEGLVTLVEEEEILAKYFKKVKSSVKKKLNKEITAPRKRPNFDQGYAERAWSGKVSPGDVGMIQGSTNIGGF